MGDGLTYTYDFGDTWQHTLRLEAVQPRNPDDPVAECVAGERACPPEDVGGIGGYQEVLDGLNGANSDDEGLAEQLAWLPDGFDPAEFSVEAVNQVLSVGPLPDLTGWNPAIGDLLYRAGGSPLSPMGQLIRQATAGPVGLTEDQIATAVHPYALLLRTVGDGVKLTPAGYLPPKVVHEVYAGLGLDMPWLSKGNREDATVPVLVLRESATSLGLLRKNRGMLLVTKAGRQLMDDPEGLWRHIASRLPLGRPEERDAGLIVLAITAAGIDGAPAVMQAAAALMESLGWMVAGGEMSRAVSYFARPTRNVLTSLTGWGKDTAAKAAVAKELLRRPEP